MCVVDQIKDSQISKLLAFIQSWGLEFATLEAIL